MVYSYNGTRKRRDGLISPITHINLVTLNCIQTFKCILNKMRMAFLLFIGIQVHNLYFMCLFHGKFLFLHLMGERLHAG